MIGCADVWAAPYAEPDIKIILNGSRLSMPVNPTKLHNQIYVPLRPVCDALGVTVTWSRETKTASFIKDGRRRSTHGVLVDGRTLVSVSFLSKAFGLQAEYLDALHVLLMSDDGRQYTQEEALGLLPQYNGYSEEDLYWLAKIVEAEARGESFDSKLGVANVILNRVNSPSYPDTIKDVIFDSNYGVQFTPTANGSVYNTASDESMLAAIEALEGKNIASSTLFFLNPKHATSNWVQNNRTYAFSIGGHSYFY